MQIHTKLSTTPFWTTLTPLGMVKEPFDETSWVHSLEWAYGPYCFAARYLELCALGGHFEFAKNRFFLFLLNSLNKFGQSILAFLIIKLYGHYSASHVIWSPPPIPVVTPGLKKNCFLRFHLITGFKVENPYGPAFMNAAWKEFCVSCTFGPLPPVFSPGATKVNFPDFAR